MAHPVGHEDDHGMTKRTPDRGERNARIATGSFRYGVARFDTPFVVRSPENMECHPVLNAAGHVHVLGFRVNNPFLSIEGIADCEERRIPNNVFDAFESGCFPCDRFLHQRHILPLEKVRVYKYDIFD
jgi:hypothetical protein